MNSSLTSLWKRWKKIVSNRSFWILVVVLIGTTFLHYYTPQIRLLASYPITRHAAERIIFILAAVSATFAFGYVGGLVTLALVVLLMLPRVFLISSHPVDAFVEVVINTITTVLTQSLELEQILNDVLDRILDVMDAEAGAVYLLSELASGGDRNCERVEIGQDAYPLRGL